MANYIKQLKDSEEVNGIFPISVAQAIYTSDMSTTVDAKLGELEGDVTSMETEMAGKAPLASPALTGTPTAPTPATADNSTKIATTAFVQAVVADLGGGGGGIVVSAEQPVGQEVGGLWYKLLN